MADNQDCGSHFSGKIEKRQRREWINKVVKSFGHLVEYAFSMVLAGFIAIMTDGLARAFGRTVGSVFWHVIRIRRRHVVESLGLAFPEKDPEEIKRIGLACYRHLGRVFAEFFRVFRKNAAWMERNINVEGREIMDEALSQGRGVIYVTFHYGDWELMGAYLTLHRYPLDAIYRSQTNPYFDRYVRGQRETHGMGLLSADRASRQVTRSLSAGRIVGFIADQDAHQAGVFVDFLGRPASTPRGPGTYAFKTGAPVVMGFIIPLEQDKWKLVFELAPRPASEDREQFITELTARINNRLADYVRRAPEFWFWPHRRWKTGMTEEILNQQSSKLEENRSSEGFSAATLSRDLRRNG